MILRRRWGITTITFAGTNAAGVADTVTIQDGVTNAITVNLDAIDDGGITDDVSSNYRILHVNLISLVVRWCRYPFIT